MLTLLIHVFKCILQNIELRLQYSIINEHCKSYTVLILLKNICICLKTNIEKNLLSLFHTILFEFQNNHLFCNVIIIYHECNGLQRFILVAQGPSPF